MQETRTGRRIGLGALGLACCFSVINPGHSQTTVPALIIAELDYIDTSGEVRDQQNDHARRLKVFIEALRSDIATSGKFRVVTFDCSPPGCPASSTPQDELLTEAAKAGAAYLLLGGVHKMSTLVQWAKVQVLDVSRQKVIFDRLLTFRGDDDGSWQHAEKFLARDILKETAFK